MIRKRSNNELQQLVGHRPDEASLAGYPAEHQTYNVQTSRQALELSVVAEWRIPGEKKRHKYVPRHVRVAYHGDQGAESLL